MDRRDEDSGAIAWPGFVDILSAVIIMFIFFVMITAIVMFALSVEHQKAMEEQNEERLQEMVSDEIKEIIEQMQSGNISLDDIKNSANSQEKIQTLSQDNQKLTDENQRLEHEVDKLSGMIKQVEADFSQNEKQDMIADEKQFTVLFSYNDISLSDETSKALSTFIQSAIAAHAGQDYAIEILACDNPDAPTISISRELSLARALNVRNVAINDKINPEAVSFRFTKPDKIKDSYNWIKIGVIAK